MKWVAIRIEGKKIVTDNDGHCQISGSDESDKDLAIS